MSVKLYTCQSCGKSDTDKTLFKMLVMMKIGFVTCNDCIKGGGKNEEE